MKKMKWLALLAVLVLGLSVFAACGGSADTCKVTYFDADAKTVLKEIKVDKGEKAENWTPEKEGWTFLGCTRRPASNVLSRSTIPSTRTLRCFPVGNRLCFRKIRANG